MKDLIGMKGYKIILYIDICQIFKGSNYKYYNIFKITHTLT